MRFVTIFCSLFFCLNLAFATDFSKDYEKCAQLASSAEDMMQCAVTEDKRLDEKLQKVYQTVNSQLMGEEIKQFSQSQKAWERYQLLHCEMEETIIAGDTTFARCMLDLKAKRIQELKDLLVR